jgi:hypothetical protein
MNIIHQKSQEEIALELFIYLTSGQVKSGIEFKQVKNMNIFSGEDSESYISLDNRRHSYLQLFKDCLITVKDDNNDQSSNSK